jgi:hypothetical protein
MMFGYWDSEYFDAVGCWTLKLGGKPVTSWQKESVIMLKFLYFGQLELEHYTTA